LKAEYSPLNSNLTQISMKKVLGLAALYCAIVFTQHIQAQDIVGSTSHMMVADGKLIIGGAFEKSDRRVVNNVTTWDGTKFSGLGKGVDGSCKGLASDGKNIYVAGNFTVVNKGTDETGVVNSNRVAKWDGEKWQSLGDRTVDRDVFCVAAKDGKLYIGGNFTKVGGSVETQSVAVYDGKQWSGLGNAKFDRAVTSMAILGNDLYCGGIFTLNGDEPMERFAKWDGTNWSEPVSGGLRGINAMAVSGNNLVLGGDFGVKLFDGTKLNEIPDAPKGRIVTVFVDGSNLYIGGEITSVKVGKKEVPTGGVAMWDGTKWSAFPEIPYTSIRCLAVYNGELYVGGNFESNAFNGVAKFVNGAWTKVQN
jgi:trimeric autotransporter adhesin